MERKRNYKKREREREEKLYGLEEKDNIVMFTDQICQKKKKVKKEKKRGGPLVEAQHFWVHYK